MNEPIQLAEMQFNYAAFLFEVGQQDEAIQLAQIALSTFEMNGTYG